MADLELLGRLCRARGISGAEADVREIIRAELDGVADEITVTPLGNLIAFKRGRRRAGTTLMLSAHMDEVGMIVTQLGEDGLLRFSTVGGIDEKVLCGRAVTVGEGSKAVSGVIGAKPIHLLEGDEKGKPVPVKDLYIDIGAENMQEAARAVSPGDMATFDSVFVLQEGAIISRALDDRAGCALLLGVMKQELEYDMTFAFVVQEEVGLNGGKTAAFAVAPQAALVAEATTAADVPGVEKERQVCCVGQGPVVSFMDRATIYDKEYYKLAFEVAKESNLPCQPKTGVAGGNDAGAIHVSRAGVRTIAVSLPCRYLHSAAGVVAESDFHAAQELILRLAQRIAGS